MENKKKMLKEMVGGKCSCGCKRGECKCGSDCKCGCNKGGKGGPGMYKKLGKC